MQPTIFYSWQSDNSKTRTYIEKALRLAIGKIADNPALETAPPRLDKDTQDVAGAVHIVDTIKNKINQCGVFLADVSLVDKASSGRSIVNQNVMFELGYTIGKHTEARVIMVANSDLGDIKELPFDISHHRTIPFSPKEDPKGIKLAASLESAINIHLQALATEQKASKLESHRDKLIFAIENDKPTHSLAENYFESVYSQYLALSPGRHQNGNREEYAEKVFKAYEDTKDTTLELFVVLQMAAEYKKEDVLLQAYKSLEIASQYYDIMPEDNGSLSDDSKDYYEFIVNEVASLIFGCITREKLWSAMTTIALTKLNRPDNYQEQRTLDRLYGYPQNTLEYYKKLKNANYTIPQSPIIEERFSDSKKVYQAYVEGSLLRYFIADTFPWAAGAVLGSSWLRYVPSFIEEFKNIDFSTAMKELTGEKTWQEWQDRVWSQASKNMGDWAYSNDNLLHLFRHVGIKSKDDLYSPNTILYGGLR